MSYISAYGIVAGDTIAPGGMFAARGVVTDVTTPTHPAAEQAGFVVVWIDYLNGHAPRPVTLAPERDVWRDDDAPLTRPTGWMHDPTWREH